jgi:hypothetical protein
MTTSRAVETHIKRAARALVEAALLRARQEQPGEVPQYYRDLLTDGQYFLDDQFEADFWAAVAQETDRQLGL